MLIAPLLSTVILQYTSMNLMLNSLNVNASLQYACLVLQSFILDQSKYSKIALSAYPNNGNRQATCKPCIDM